MYSTGSKKIISKSDRSYLKVVTDLGRSDKGIFNNIVRILIVFNFLYLGSYYILCLINGTITESEGPLTVALNLERNNFAQILDFVYASIMFIAFFIFLKYTLYFRLKKGSRR